jgi:uroporphyrin-III C-methyltransferase
VTPAADVRVHLVGAGPGAVDLLTVRALRLLERAEVVLHDALVHPDVLALAAHARRIPVGKRANLPSTAQRFINKTLVDQARTGRRVVRLKGGDPAVFGRLDEETEALRAAGIAFEVVPGITAASAAAAELGVSLTLRAVARSVTFLTPCTCDDGDDGTWLPAAELLATGGTLAVYMGGRQIAATAERLVRAAPGTTPIAVVQGASLNGAAHWVGTLDGAIAAPPPVGAGPVLLLIGPALRGLAATRAVPAADAAERVAA